MLKQIIIELLRLGIALATMLLTRWMFELAKPEDDIRWMKNTLDDITFELKRLKWYRGMEYIHQIKFRRMFES